MSHRIKGRHKPRHHTHAVKKENRSKLMPWQIVPPVVPATETEQSNETPATAEQESTAPVTA